MKKTRTSATKPTTTSTKRTRTSSRRQDVSDEADDDVEDEEDEDIVDEEDEDVSDEADDDFDEEDDDGEAPSGVEDELRDLQANLGDDWILRFSVQGDASWLTAETDDGSQHVEAPTVDELAEVVERLNEGGGRAS